APPPRPRAPEGARAHPPAGGGRSEPGTGALRPAAGRGPRRHAPPPPAPHADARERPSPDGHADERVSSERIRPRTGRFLDPAERARALVLGRAGGPGPLCDRPSGPVA